MELSALALTETVNRNMDSLTTTAPGASESERQFALVTGYVLPFKLEAHASEGMEREAERAEFRPQFLAGDSNLDREKDDYYKTPEHATRALLSRETFEGVTWEPACGNGAISRLLPGTVISTDLHDRGFGESGVDFLREIRPVDNVVTNPPYVLAREFVEHALKCARYKVAMLLKLNFLESQERYPFFENTPLRCVYVFSQRLSFDKGNEAGKGNGLLAYAWFVWDHRKEGPTQLGWLPPVGRAAGAGVGIKRAVSKRKGPNKEIAKE